MDELQILLSKLHRSKQQKFSEFESIISASAGLNQEEALQKKLSMLEARIQDQQNTHKKAISSSKQQLKSLLVESEVKRTKKSASKKLISTLQEELAHLCMQEKTLREASNGEAKIKQLEEEEALSARCLSLEIKKVKGEWLQFVFTNINRQKPDSPFVFSLKLDENRKYIVGDCQPEISDMDMLVDKLNSSNNLSAFVRSVRKRFTGMVSK